MAKEVSRSVLQEEYDRALRRVESLDRQLAEVKSVMEYAVKQKLATLQRSAGERLKRCENALGYARAVAGDLAKAVGALQL